MAERTRILIVDDDRAVVEYLVEMLGERYMVETETSPEAALPTLSS